MDKRKKRPNISIDEHWKKRNYYYHEQLGRFYKVYVPPGKDVLEIGCDTADALSSLQPSLGLGVDIDGAKIAVARQNHPHLRLVVADAEALALNKRFDYIIMADLIDHVDDIWKVIREAEGVMAEGGCLVIHTINPIWGLFFSIFEALRWKKPEKQHNFIHLGDITSLLELFCLRVKKEGYFVFFPKRIPVISDILNLCLPHIPLFRKLCFCQYLISEREESVRLLDKKLSVSVVIPCHNEELNVSPCLARIPQMANVQEIIFIDDGSTDKTNEALQDLQEKDNRVKVITYPERQGKGYAVKKGFQAATGDVLVILDADMAVMPEDLPKFFSAINQGRADFVNGTRMVYPVKQAMNILHALGNKIFSLLFSWILGQHITDTLCGTKAFLKRDYEKIRLISKDDPWGDFDLLLGAAKLNLRIVEIPVRYQKRIHGYSKMQPFKHGFILLRRCLWGFKEMKVDKILEKIFRKPR